MSPIIKSKLVVLTIFLAISGGLLTWHIVYVWPARACENSGRWWAGRMRECVTPVNVAVLTGRPNPKDRPNVATNSAPYVVGPVGPDRAPAAAPVK